MNYFVNFIILKFEISSSHTLDLSEDEKSSCKLSIESHLWLSFIELDISGARFDQRKEHIAVDGLILGRTVCQ